MPGGGTELIAGAKTVLPLVLKMVSYLRSKGKDARAQTIEQYLEWVRRQDKAETSDALASIHSMGEENAALLTDIFDLAQELTQQVQVLSQQSEVNTAILQRIEAIVSEKHEEIERERQHRQRVAIRLLEAMFQQVKGSGYKLMGDESLNSEAGTVVFQLRLGAETPEIVLHSIAGGVLENRIDLILRKTGLIEVVARDRLGGIHSIATEPVPREKFFLVFLFYRKDWIACQIGIGRRAELRLPRPLDRIGPAFLIGLDLDGEKSADQLVQGYQVDGKVGASLRKGGLGHGLHLSEIALFARELAADEVECLVAAADAESKERDALKWAPTMPSEASTSSFVILPARQVDPNSHLGKLVNFANKLKIAVSALDRGSDLFEKDASAPHPDFPDAMFRPVALKTAAEIRYYNEALIQHVWHWKDHFVNFGVAERGMSAEQSKKFIHRLVARNYALQVCGYIANHIKHGKVTNFPHLAKEQPRLETAGLRWGDHRGARLFVGLDDVERMAMSHPGPGVQTVLVRSSDGKQMGDSRGFVEEAASVWLGLLSRWGVRA